MRALSRTNVRGRPDVGGCDLRGRLARARHSHQERDPCRARHGTKSFPFLRACCMKSAGMSWWSSPHDRGGRSMSSGPPGGIVATMGAPEGLERREHHARLRRFVLARVLWAVRHRRTRDGSAHRARPVLPLRVHAKPAIVGTAVPPGADLPAERGLLARQVRIERVDFAQVITERRVWIVHIILRYCAAPLKADTAHRPTG